MPVATTSLTAPPVGLELFKQLLTPNLRSAHLLAWGATTGTMFWHGFIGGPVAYKNLPRQTFGNLQSHLFNIYFPLTTGLSAIILGTYARANPIVYQKPSEFLSSPVVYQGFTLLTTTLASAINWLIVGPKTTDIMFKRHRLEKAEGKSYNEPGVSEEMKSLNTQFASLHGVSSLLNLAAFGGILFHGLWIANYGF